MGVVRTEESERLVEIIEDLRRTLVACAGLQRRKDEEGFKGVRVVSRDVYLDEDEEQEKLVCVTSGVSFLGLAIVNRLLFRGYSVRIIVDNEEEIEKLREMETAGEMRRNSKSNISVVMAKLTVREKLLEAFEGCRGVFHTSAFVDPAGLSGYSKSMAEIEVKGTENVMEACVATSSVRRCVLTSSLLACIWQNSSLTDLPPLVNHDCWSHESLCIDRKLWYALGKLRAEKAAWRIAKNSGLRLATICPALITGPEICRRNSTSTVAYLKGAQEMYAQGLLATVDVIRLAEAHVCVFEELRKTAFGRYICFDQVIQTEGEAQKLAKEIGVPTDKISGNSSHDFPVRFELSNRKLCNLMSRTHQSCYGESLAV